MHVDPSKLLNGGRDLNSAREHDECLVLVPVAVINYEVYLATPRHISGSMTTSTTEDTESSE